MPPNRIEKLNTSNIAKLSSVPLQKVILLIKISLFLTILVVSLKLNGLGFLKWNKEGCLLFTRSYFVSLGIPFTKVGKGGSMGNVNLCKVTK